MTKIEQVMALCAAVADRIPAEGVGPSAWGYIAGIRKYERVYGELIPQLPEGVQSEPEHMRYIGPGFSSIMTQALRRLEAEGKVRTVSKGRYAGAASGGAH